MTDTIFALSSGRPPAAIAVVRISGPKALPALEVLAGKLPESKIAMLAELRDGDSLLDRAIVLRFDGPHTVTGEDLVELHLHGGRAVVDAVCRTLAAMSGMRSAEPGEFTRRAFANGKIDLTEAEGLADLLAAETESQRRAALAVAGGALRRQVETWTDRLLSLSAAVEAQLDFSDEGDVDQGLPSSWYDDLAALSRELQSYIARPPSERLRDGVRVVVAGPPNSGKSSLVNAIADREVAITSDIAGTTRDLIEVPVAISGTPFLLIDSAGLRSSADEVEAIGIQRAEQAIATSDILLWLGPPKYAPQHASLLIIHSKADLGVRPGLLNVSALTGLGLTSLIDALLASAKAVLPAEGETALNLRQRELIRGATIRLEASVTHTDLILVAEELRLARSMFDKISGRADVEAMLDALFGRFCIGK